MTTDDYLTGAAVALAVVAGFYALALSHWLSFMQKDQLSKLTELEALNQRLDALLQHAQEEKRDDNN